MSRVLMKGERLRDIEGAMSEKQKEILLALGVTTKAPERL